MKIIKINNLVQSNGVCDYKGLDLNLIVGGSQVYPHDNNVAYFYYNDDTIVSSGDIQVITQSTYDTNKQKHEDFLKTIVTPEKRIEQLEMEVEQLKSQLGTVV